MKNLAYFAIAAILLFGLASVFAPPDIWFRLEFQTSKPQPSRQALLLVALVAVIDLADAFGTVVAFWQLLAWPAGK